MPRACSSMKIAKMPWKRAKRFPPGPQKHAVDLNQGARAHSRATMILQGSSSHIETPLKAEPTDQI